MREYKHIRPKMHATLNANIFKNCITAVINHNFYHFMQNISHTCDVLQLFIYIKNMTLWQFSHNVILFILHVNKKLHYDYLVIMS